MKDLKDILKGMTLEFFGTGQHKISPSIHLSQKDAIFLDVRSEQEQKTISFSLMYHMPVLHIPICEIPDRVDEIPKDKTVGIFCSSGARAAMTYLYLRTLGYDKVRIIEGGYPNLSNECKPGNLLKYLKENS